MNQENLGNNKSNKKPKLIIFMSIIILILLITIFVVINHFTNPVTKFKKSLESNDITTMRKIYSNIDDYNDKKNIEKIFAQNLSETLDNYINDKLSYEDALNRLEQYDDLKGLKSYADASKKDLESVKKSKDKFLLGKENESNNDILNAIKNYSEVISLDKNNYQIAQDYIKSNSDNFRKSTFNEIDDLISNKDYISANNKLEELKQVFTNDDEIAKKSNEIKEKVKEQQIQEYKENQEVTVENTRIYIQHPTYKALYPDSIEVIIKNHTSKTIKNYNVSILAYDSNNYPLKVQTQYNFGKANYEFIGMAENVNIISGATGGKNYGWSLDENHGISKILALVKDVEYYDGSKWENPYYEYWIEQYKEKPLNN